MGFLVCEVFFQVSCRFLCMLLFNFSGLRVHMTENEVKLKQNVYELSVKLNSAPKSHLSYRGFGCRDIVDSLKSIMHFSCFFLVLTIL